MRNPNRIYPFLEKLVMEWKTHSDNKEQTFVGFIHSLQKFFDWDLFYVEDDRMFEYLELYFSQNNLEKNEYELTDNDYKFINAIADAWKKNASDWRFMQLFINLFGSDVRLDFPDKFVMENIGSELSAIVLGV